MYPHTTPDWELYEAHLDEAEFLEIQWERALSAPDRRWPDVASREARFLAHVDALALGGRAVAQRLLRPALESEEASRVTSAALALLVDGGEAARDAVLSAFLEGSPEPRPALRRALELCERDDLLPRLMVPLHSTGAEPDVLAAVLEVLAARGQGPGVPLEGFLSHPEPRVVAAACRVLPHPAGVPPTQPVLQRLMAALDSPVPAVRDAALVAGMIQGLRAAWLRCRQVVGSRDTPDRLPLMLLAMGGDERELELLFKRLEEPRLRTDVAWALGHSGRVAAIERCLELLDDADAGVVRLATESLATMTGFPLEGGHVEQEETSHEEAETPDATVEQEVEKTLPRATPAAARTWWTKERERFVSGTRYLGGVPFSIKALVRAFGTMPARRWSALTLELAIRSRGRGIVTPRALSAQRQQQLTRLTGFAPRGEQTFSAFLDL
ncbi:TIGR02270 family protein [Archangium violaceum]|uniref:TIGR02270 family protein n=1 Tax=Archangium violaceum TaxID=83451 RepID=UPI000698F960|nr:TIGR02270 family protein [Archangium violaceum]